MDTYMVPTPQGLPAPAKRVRYCAKPWSVFEYEARDDGAPRFDEYYAVNDDTLEVIDLHPITHDDAMSLTAAQIEERRTLTVHGKAVA